MPRFDTLTPIHKALRALVYEAAATCSQRLRRRAEAAGAAADLELALRLMQRPPHHEEVYFFPKLQPLESSSGIDAGAARERGATAGRRDDARRRCALATRRPASRPASTLNRRFNELIALFLEHLAHEEATLLPATWRHFDDAQLVAIQGAIIAEMEPTS